MTPESREQIQKNRKRVIWYCSMLIFVFVALLSIVIDYVLNYNFRLWLIGSLTVASLVSIFKIVGKFKLD